MIGAKISVKNFLGLNVADLEIGEVTIFIGPQASGKSVVAKLIYFFHNYVKDLEDITRTERTADFDKRLQKYNEEHLKDFARLFPIGARGFGDFEIEYKKQEVNIKISKSSQGISIQPSESFLKKYRDLAEKYVAIRESAERLGIPRWYISEEFSFEFSLRRISSYLSRARSEDKGELEDKHLEEFLESYKGFGIQKERYLPAYGDVLYIPAARSFFATLRDQFFAVIRMDETVDPILLQFGEVWKRMRDVQELSISRGRLFESCRREKGSPEWKELLKASYERDDEKDILVSEGGRRTLLASASSGQQELLPLLMGLRYVLQAARRYGLMIIEEPEAHIFPDAQVKLTKRIVETGKKRKIPMLLTTHSPYVLSGVNNEILKNKVELKEKKIAKGELQVRAYGFEDGRAKSLMDEETGLVVAEYIDEASNVLGEEFEELCQKLSELETEGTES